MPKTLIKNGHVISMDEQLGDIASGDVLIENERIVEVGLDLQADDAETIDASDMIVMPGFVNAHLHTWQTGIRGTSGDLTIMGYIGRIIAQCAPLYTPDDMRISNLVGALNQINAGTTTLFDWCHNNRTPEHTDAAIDGLIESGIRAVFGHGTPKPEPKDGEVIDAEVTQPRAEVERLRNGPFASDDGLVTLALVIPGPDFTTYEVTRHDIELAREFGLISSAHIWGSPMRVTKDGIYRLAEDKLLGPDFNLVHGCFLSDDELKILVDAGVSVTVTAEVEMQSSGGNPLTGRLLSLKALPSIGADVETMVSGDMFNVMRIGLDHQRALDSQQALRDGKRSETYTINGRDALEWATVGGARALKLEHRIGTLAPGKQADIVLIRTTDINLVPVKYPVESVVFHANASNVDTVLIAGTAVKRDGKLSIPNLSGKLQALAQSSQRILEAAGIH